MRAAFAHAPRACRARGGALLLAFWMAWDGMGGTGMTKARAREGSERRFPEGTADWACTVGRL